MNQFHISVKTVKLILENRSFRLHSDQLHFMLMKQVVSLLWYNKFIISLYLICYYSFVKILDLSFFIFTFLNLFFSFSYFGSSPSIKNRFISLTII